MPRKPKPPTYRLHKPTGQALVEVAGQRIYLGKHGTPDSHERYNRVVAEWLTTGAVPVAKPPAAEATDGLLIVELVAAYWQRHVTQHYVKDGTPTSEQACIRAALRPVKELYGTTPAAHFGPLKLKAVRQTMIDRHLARSTINHDCQRIKGMFRWAVSEELLSPAVYQGLATVAGLRAGRTKAREPAPVRPVDDDLVNATLPHLTAVVADMVRLQRLTGMRPGEVCQLRPRDLDRSGKAWCYIPASHKTQHHGRERRIFIGPRAQSVLLPYLVRAADACCFSPLESEAKRNARRRDERQTPRWPSHQKRRPQRRRRKLLDRYTRDTYTHAIRRGCERVTGLVRPTRPKDAATNAERLAEYLNKLAEFNKRLRAVLWSPNQLRHTAATELRKRFGIEAAQVTLGHSRADVTQVYAERDFGKAAAIMAEVG